MKTVPTVVLLCAFWGMIGTYGSGNSRRLAQSGALPVLANGAPAPAPGTAGPPCTCSIASIYSGVTYCFAVSNTPGSAAKQASPNCKVFTSGYTCTDRIVTLAPGLQTSEYPNTTISGQGIQCSLNSFRGPVPAPAAPPASANAPSCITLPAGDYGPTGIIAYANGPNNAATPDCTVSPGTVCSIYIPVGNGTGKVCASQTAEDNLRG